MTSFGAKGKLPVPVRTSAAEGSEDIRGRIENQQRLIKGKMFWRSEGVRFTVRI